MGITGSDKYFSEIDESLSERILGVKVSRTLCNWRVHTDIVLRKCAEKLNALKIGGKMFTFKRRLTTGKAVYLAKLFYAIELWGVTGLLLPPYIISHRKNQGNLIIFIIINVGDSAWRWVGPLGREKFVT